MRTLDLYRQDRGFLVTLANTMRDALLPAFPRELGDAFDFSMTAKSDLCDLIESLFELTAIAAKRAGAK